QRDGWTAGQIVRAQEGPVNPRAVVFLAVHARLQCRDGWGRAGHRGEQQRVRATEELGRRATQQLALAQPAHVLVRRDLERPRHALSYVGAVAVGILREEWPVEFRVLRASDRAEHLEEATAVSEGHRLHLRAEILERDDRTLERARHLGVDLGI